MSKETLGFKIGLSGDFWDKAPQYKILVNSDVVAEGVADSATTKIVEFEVTVDEDADHVLSIRLENKADSDVIQNEDKSAILKDMLLNIDSIEIDGIELGNLKWSKSLYTPDDTGFSPIEGCVNLGHNGSYKLTFSSPFYLWLLENM